MFSSGIVSNLRGSSLEINKFSLVVICVREMLFLESHLPTANCVLITPILPTKLLLFAYAVSPEHKSQ